MRIHKARQNHASATVDFNNFLAMLLKPCIANGVFRCADRDNLSAHAYHGAVFDDRKFRERSAASRPHHWRAQREELADVDQKYSALRSSVAFRGGNHAEGKSTSQTEK